MTFTRKYGFRKGKRRILIIKKLCKGIRIQILELNLDFPIAIVGPTGFGKSTIAEIIAREVDDDYSVERNTFFAPTIEQANNFFLNQPKGSAPIFDEFGDVGYKMDFANSLSKFLKKLFMKNRQANMCPMMCIPNFLDIDRYYRSRIKLLIFVYARGKFVAFKPLKFNIFTGDNWQVKYNLKIWDSLLKGKPVTNSKTFLKVVRKWSIYYGEGVFPQMFKKDERRYVELKTEYFQKGSKDVDFEALKVKDSKKTVILKRFISSLREKGVPMKILIEYTGLTSTTLTAYAKFEDNKLPLFNNIITMCKSNLDLNNSIGHNKDYVNRVKNPNAKSNKRIKTLTPDNIEPKNNDVLLPEVGGIDTL